MARKDIGTGWDRENRNAINDNFKELFEKVNDLGPEGNPINIKTPTGFDWINHPLKGRIFFKPKINEFYTNFDVSEMKIKGEGETYYVSPYGDDSNDGLSWESPMRTIYKAVDKEDALTVYVKEGIYKRFEGLWPSGHEDKNINIIGEGEVILTTHDELNYTLTEGYSNVYESNRSQVGVIVDSSFIDAHGDFKKLQRVSSIKEVESTPSSWYTDNAKIYIRTEDSRKPDSKIMPFLVTGNGYFKGDSSIYLENLNFYGGRACIETGLNNKNDELNLYLKNCEAKYSNELHDAMRIRGTKLAIFQDCLCSFAGRDGFNYHEDLGIVPKVLEINCIGRKNGHTAQDNGTTGHDGVKIIRLNGEHFDNPGPNVIDVNENTQSWNLGVKSIYSNQEFINPETFAVGQDTGKSSMWLDNCVGYGANARVGSDSHLYIKDSKIKKGKIDGEVYKY